MKGMQNKLRAALQKKGIQSSELARDSEVHYLKIIRLLGQYDRPNREEAIRIAGVLGVKPEEVFDMEALPFARRQRLSGANSL